MGNFLDGGGGWCKSRLTLLAKFKKIDCWVAFAPLCIPYTQMSLTNSNTVKGKAVPLTGLEWPRGFQEVKVPRFHDNGTGWW